MNAKIGIFICYAHEDESLMRELEYHLNVLVQQELVGLWHDRMIAGGADWEQETNKQLDAAHIILLLVSAQFLFSEDCSLIIKRAMERHMKGEAKVIPVILRPVLWKGSAFGQLEAVPQNERPIISSAWHSRDEAWIDVVEGVQQVANELRSSIVPIVIQHNPDKVLDEPKKERPVTQHTTFDVFLCYNHTDKQAVKNIGQQLKMRGIKPWFDEWELRPGFPWQRALEVEIVRIKAAAVFVSNDGIGPWQNMEADAILSEFVQRGCPVIPVLLADAPKTPQIPLFLRNMTWVDFRVQEPDPIKQLIWGITMKQPDGNVPKDGTYLPSVVPPPP